MWELPRSTHRYYVEELGGEHLWSMVLSRYVNFLKLIKKSSKPGVLLLFSMVEENLNTVTGRNIRFIKDTIGYEDIFQLSCRDLKEKLIFKKIPPEEKWRVNFVRELTDVRRGTLALGDESTDDDVFSLEEEVLMILDYICTK